MKRKYPAKNASSAHIPSGIDLRQQAEAKLLGKQKAAGFDKANVVIGDRRVALQWEPSRFNLDSKSTLVPRRMSP